jgi:hypothetical protein
MTLYLAPLVMLTGAMLMVFGNATAQRLATAMWWLGLAFTLYQFGGHALALLH